MPALVIIQPVSAGLLLIDAARRHGLQPVVLSHEQADRTLPDSVRGDGIEIVEVDTHDQAAVLALVDKLAGVHDIVGVVPGFEYFVPTAARVAAALGLPGLDPEVAERVRDKTLMRQALERAGLDIPRFRVASSPAEVEAAAEAVGYPLVLKPPRAAGSVHVSRVDDLDGLRAAYHLLSTDTDSDLGNDMGRHVLLESYLDGPEYSAEGYVAGGVATVVSITEKLLSDLPAFVELGHTVPADLPAPQLAELADWTARVAEALEVDNALFHLEFRICGGRPYVIELGARMPGDQIARLVELSTGVSLADVLVELATGTKGSDARGLGVRFERTAAIRFFREPGLDEITRVPATADLLAGPNVESAGVIATVGGRPNVHSDFRSRLGWVVLTAADRLALEEAWQQVAGLADFG